MRTAKDESTAMLRRRDVRMGSEVEDLVVGVTEAVGTAEEEVADHILRVSPQETGCAASNRLDPTMVMTHPGMEAVIADMEDTEASNGDDLEVRLG